MPHPQLAHAEASVLVVIDFQEPFVKAMAERETVTENIGKLIHLAQVLEIPILVTEQNVERLGPTVPEVREVLEEAGAYRPIDKLAFSCCSVDEFVQQVHDSDRDTLLVTGVEGHICVQQTTLEALNLGYKVHVIRDAVTSRLPHNLELATEKMRHAGAMISSTEMVAYELLGEAGTPQFKSALKFLKW
jgi:nicotinamidase-related amidase